MARSYRPLSFASLAGGRPERETRAMPNPVTSVPAAAPAAALRHFAARLAFETDADDVAAALALDDGRLVVLDARGPAAYAAGHLPGARSLPRPYAAADVAALPPGLVVVYCWGPGCNGATKAARELAALGRPVKEMLGGFEYWVREGHPVEGADAAALAGAADDRGLVRLPRAVSCLC
jgi:rhodanese-related sulfurtransferase